MSLSSLCARAPNSAFGTSYNRKLTAAIYINRCAQFASCVQINHQATEGWNIQAGKINEKKVTQYVMLIN